MPTTFKLGDHQYQSGQLNALTQFHIARRLAPVLDSLKELLKADKDPMGAFSSLAKAVGKLSDEDSEYVIGNCLSVVTREQGAGWARVWSAGGGLMFQDIDMPTMLQLVGRVIMDNMGSFMDALPQGSIDAALASASTR